MNLYRQLDTAYHHLTRQPPPTWITSLDADNLDGVTTAIRDDQPDAARSDATLLRLLGIARSHQDAMTVAMYALAPKLRARLGQTVTDEYRTDALTDLAFVMLDGTLDGSRLAGRLVNRAHNRTHKAARAVHTRGVVNVTTTIPHDPALLAARPAPGCTNDIATVATQRADLARFHTAIRSQIDTGELTEQAWAAYRDHRLARALDSGARLCTSHERTTASRAARKLHTIANAHLHAA